MSAGAPGPRRPPWSAFRAALAAEGFRPTKARGQNFLVDANMARAIARDAGVGEGDVVLEVGPGCGFLSVELAALGVELLAVEIDPALHRVASAFLAPCAGVRLLRADVLAGKHRLAPEVASLLPRAGPWHVVSNLPYSIAGPLLVVLARLGNPPASVTALVQEELAGRIAARPGERAWGRLGAKLAPVFEARRGRAVGRQLFWPRPRVESAVVHLVLRPGRPADLGPYDALVDALFATRRQTVGRSLRGILGDAGAARELLERLGIDPRARPEELSAGDLAALAVARGPGP